MSTQAAVKRRVIQVSVNGDAFFNGSAVTPLYEVPKDDPVPARPALAEKLLPAERQVVAKLKALPLTANSIAEIIGKATALHETGALKERFEGDLETMPPGELAAALVLTARAKAISPAVLLQAADQYVSLVAPSAEQQLADFCATKGKLSARVTNETRGQAFAADFEMVRRKLEALAGSLGDGALRVEVLRYAALHTRECKTQPAERLALLKLEKRRFLNFLLGPRKRILAVLCREAGVWAKGESSSAKRRWRKSGKVCANVVNYDDNPGSLRFNAYINSAQFTAALNNAPEGKALQEHLKKVVLDYKPEALKNAWT